MHHIIIRKGTCAEIQFSKYYDISTNTFTQSAYCRFGTFTFFQRGFGRTEDPASFLKFSTDFDAKCVVRGGVMIYISNTHSTGKIKVLLERWYMDNRTADRGRSVLMPGAEPEALGCSLVSKGKQEWRVLKSEWVK